MKPSRELNTRAKALGGSPTMMSSRRLVSHPFTARMAMAVSVIQAKLAGAEAG